MWKLLAGILLSVAVTEPALAISRHQTMSMSCADVQATVRREGAVILRWQSNRTPGLPLFGRYVSDRRFCQLGEVTNFASVPTADTRACTVRECVRPDFDMRDRWWRTR